MHLRFSPLLRSLCGKTSVRSLLAVCASLAAAPAAAQTAASYTIDTIAGTAEVRDGGPATAAWLRSPTAAAADAAGNLYIADSGNHRIRRVDAAGNIATVAGTGTYGFSGDGGPATAAQLRSPTDVAIDAAGNLYIADSENHRIRRVDAAGNIATVAGTGADGFSGDGGPAAAAQLYAPRDVAVDGAGNFYIADQGSHRIRRVDTTGNIATVAGTGADGFSGDGGPATAAQLWRPLGVTANAAGNLYVADTANHRIRKIGTDGNIATVAGTGTHGSDGEDVPATAARLYFPRGAAVDGAGNLYVADTENHRIRKIGADGNIADFAGEARLISPHGVAVDSAGNLYIADTLNNFIHRVDAGGNISIFAGTRLSGFRGDGFPATAVRLYFPRGVAADDAGNVYIADTRNNLIRRVGADGNIFTVAGTEAYGFSGDGGPATAARLWLPRGVAADGAGNVYIADWGNNRVRRVDADGNISTLAGTGTRGSGGDGGPATAAQLSSPYDVAVDGAGNVYIADAFNYRIRRVDADGNISTIAGTGASGFSGDGGPATAAQLNAPQSVTADSAGNVYIADTFNHRIRRLTPAATAAPRISAGGIVTATGTPLVNRVSPNALISVFGQAFAPQETQTLSPQLDASGRVAANLAGACLEIGGKRAALFAVTPNQINAQAPHDLTPGQTQAAVVRNCAAAQKRRSPSARSRRPSSTC